MIRNYHTTITDYIFNKKTFSELKESTFGDKWPVVYIIEDKGKRLAYIGETTNICNRINQHWNNPKRKKLKIPVPARFWAGIFACFGAGSTISEKTLFFTGIISALLLFSFGRFCDIIYVCILLLQAADIAL